MVMATAMATATAMAVEPDSRADRGEEGNDIRALVSFDTFTENYATAIDATVVSSTFFGSLQNRSIAAPFRKIFLAQQRAFENVWY